MKHILLDLNDKSIIVFNSLEKLDQAVGEMMREADYIFEDYIFNHESSNSCFLIKDWKEETSVFVDTEFEVETHLNYNLNADDTYVKTYVTIINLKTKREITPNTVMEI